MLCVFFEVGIEFLNSLCYVHYGDLILRELDYIVTISFGYILYCVCFSLDCGGFKLFCDVWGVCVWVCVCGCVCVGVL
jgi:hypothetical protein